MNFTNCIRTSLFFLLTFVSITDLYPNTSDTPPAPAAINKMEQEYYEQFLRQHLAQFKAIDRIIEDMLLLVEHNAITVNSKPTFRTNAMAVKDFINTLNNEAFVQPDAQRVQLLGFLSTSLMHHLIHALDNLLVDFPPFELENVIINHVTRYDISLEDLQNNVAKGNELLEVLTAKSKEAGLRWYNKAYRTFDHYVLQPTAKYKLHVRGGVALGCAAMATLLAFRTTFELRWDGTNFFGLFAKKRFGFDLRNGGLGLGYWPMHTGEGNRLDTAYHKGYDFDPDTGVNSKFTGHERPIRWLGHFTKHIRDLYKGDAPHETLIWGMLSFNVYKEWDHIKHWTNKKVNKLHNFLKGGTYAEKQENKFLINPRVTFKDLVGLDHVKETLSFIVQYMEDPERFDRARLTPEKGYILTGPTRTGKSYSAEALAGEIKELFKRTGRNPDDFSFFVLTANFILTEGIDNILARAKAIAPCILFIDEIDLMGLQRTGNAELLSRFLSAMSGCIESDPEKVVIMMAATNKPENLDKALVQAGRFGKELRFEYPCFKDRKEFLTKKISTLANVHAFDIDQLARETEGRSFELLNSMIKRAFQKGIVRGEVLTNDMLELCHDEEIRGIINAEDSLPPMHERELIAAHQAGVALTALLLNSHERLAKVTIKPYLAEVEEESVYDQYYKKGEQQQKKIKYGRTYTYHLNDTKNIFNFKERMAQCKILLAGFVAEKIIFGDCAYDYNRDNAKHAFTIARSMATKGLDINEFSDVIRGKYQEMALKIQESCEQEITALLEQHKDKLILLAKELAQRQTLRGAEVAALVGLPSPYLNEKTDSQALAQELGIAEVKA